VDVLPSGVVYWRERGACAFSRRGLVGSEHEDMATTKLNGHAARGNLRRVFLAIVDQEVE